MSALSLTFAGLTAALSPSSKATHQSRDLSTLQMLLASNQKLVSLRKRQIADLEDVLAESKRGLVQLELDGEELLDEIDAAEVAS